MRQPVGKWQWQMVLWEGTPPYIQRMILLYSTPVICRSPHSPTSQPSRQLDRVLLQPCQQRIPGRPKVTMKKEMTEGRKRNQIDCAILWDYYLQGRGRGAPGPGTEVWLWAAWGKWGRLASSTMETSSLVTRWMITCWRGRSPDRCSTASKQAGLLTLQMGSVSSLLSRN